MARAQRHLGPPHAAPTPRSRGRPLRRHQPPLPPRPPPAEAHPAPGTVDSLPLPAPRPQLRDPLPRLRPLRRSLQAPPREHPRRHPRRSLLPRSFPPQRPRRHPRRLRHPLDLDRPRRPRRPRPSRLGEPPPRQPELGPILKPWQSLLELPSTPDAYFTTLRDGIGRAQDALTAFLTAEKLGQRELTSEAPGPLEGIRTLDGLAEASGLRHTYSTGILALDHAGALFRDFRSTLRRRDRGQPPLPDYFEVKGSLQNPGSPPRHVDRAAFGLPLRFFYRSLNGATTTLNPRPPGSTRPADRLASPLFFRVYKLGDGKHGVALISLAGKATAPPLQGAQILSQRSRDATPPPSSRIINDWKRNWRCDRKS